MKRTMLDALPEGLPERIIEFIGDAKVYDSSSSPEARVYFVEKEQGFYIKRAVRGSLKREAELTRYFHKKGFGASVVDYLSLDEDYFITEKVRGEDMTHGIYVAEPKRVCDTVAEKLRELHETDFSDCPVMHRNTEYLALAEKNYRTDNYDKSYFPDSFGYSSGDEAYAALTRGKDALREEVLLHGDYCLPNLILDNWRFSAFIDVGNGGVGDRHIDLFWGAWSLWFNLKTDEYRDRFFDVYGRDKVDEEILKTIAAAEVFG